MISVKNISKSYKNVRALIDFTYDFENGIYAVLGPNGSGKSTLMNIMTGNLKQDSGKVIFSNGGREENISDRFLGYVPQYPGMYPHFSSYEMLDYVGILKGAQAREKQIEHLLEAFDLGEYKYKKINSLSGGTKQRLAIAQAFMGTPTLVILDEPTAGLDPMQRINVKNFLSEQKNKTTIIISTHIVSDVENIADKIIFLKKGMITLSGSLDDIISRVNGKCFSLPCEKMPESFKGIFRVCGTEVRIISEDTPFPEAEKVLPELEDCYLSVFGMGDQT